MVLMVQSPGASASTVRAAADTFLHGQAKEGAVTEAQFLRHRAALVRDIMEPHKNLWEESDYFWQEIARRELDFASRDRLATAVGAIDFGHWRDWYQRVLLDDRASLLAVSSGRWGEVPAGKVVSDPETFRRAQPSYRRE